MKLKIEEKETKYFDLEDRTLEFALCTADFLCELPHTVVNRVYISQLARSSSSIGANYREANSNLGKKDFAYRIGVCRKEAKESVYWFKLLRTQGCTKEQMVTKEALEKEARELELIFSAIRRKVI